MALEVGQNQVRDEKKRNGVLCGLFVFLLFFLFACSSLFSVLLEDDG